MSHFPDTSFLCALYRMQVHSLKAEHLGASEFLTFDANQKKLAESEGLFVPV